MDLVEGVERPVRSLRTPPVLAYLPICRSIASFGTTTQIECSVCVCVRMRACLLAYMRACGRAGGRVGDSV